MARGFRVGVEPGGLAAARAMARHVEVVLDREGETREGSVRVRGCRARVAVVHEASALARARNVGEDVHDARGVAVRPSKRRPRTTGGDRKIPRGSRVPSDPCTNPEMVEAYRPLGEHGGAARRGPHVHSPPRGRDVDWGSPSGGIPGTAREKLETVLLSQPGERALSQVIPFAVVTNTRIQSAFPRTFARAP